MPPHRARRPASSAFCDLEEHNALTAHQERQRLEKDDREWLTRPTARCSCASIPTGKMVLSLTTEADGNEGELRPLVADELGVPALDVKVVPADENRFGTGHGFNTSPSDGTPAAVTSATEKIRDQGAAARRAWRSSAGGALRWDDGAFIGDGESQTIADVALYAHGSGALPPGVEGGLDAQTVYPMTSLGPDNGTLTVRTGKGGAAAKAGHNL